MKFKVIQGEKGKKRNQKDQTPASQNQGTSKAKTMDEYYAKERPRAQDMEQAEGDEDIVDAALKNQGKSAEAA